jgi:hypothetical protein
MGRSLRLKFSGISGPRDLPRGLFPKPVCARVSETVPGDAPPGTIGIGGGGCHVEPRKVSPVPCDGAWKFVITQRLQDFI